ncbi:MAG: 50S ribosomal protein L18 [Thermoprotei archaeon]
MATGPRYRVRFRRRREKVTDYRKRLRLLSSRLPRLVVRRSNRYVYVQLVSSSKAQDKVEFSASSRELADLGYASGLASTPASYLTGLLAAKRALRKGIEKAVLDIGASSNAPKSSVYAVLKGCVDGGLDVPHSEEMLPDESRLKGEHISAYAAKLKAEDEERYRRLFSKMIGSGVEPERLQSVVEEVKSKLDRLVDGGTNV